MLWIHILAGAAALVAGFAVLLSRKGDVRHRGWGRLFAYAMFTMTCTGALIAGLLRPNPGNVLMASITFYLVATGWLAVRPGTHAAPRRHVALCVLGCAAGVFGVGLATVAAQAPGRSLHGIPAVALAVFSLMVLGAAASDLRLMQARILDPQRRVLRHLWRMGLALWIATMSFFVGQADVFPQPVRASGVLALPLLWVTGALGLWIVRQIRAGRRADRARLATTSTVPAPLP